MGHDKRSINFTDYVIAQGLSDESPERVGELDISYVSDTATWSINGRLEHVFTVPELDALLKLLTDMRGKKP